MTVVSDSSPLVILTKLGCFDLLHQLFPRVYISTEVHHEVVIAGAGLPEAAEVSNAEWIEVKPIQNPVVLHSAQQTHALGLGEMSTLLLGKELGANFVLLDDYKARKLAKTEGLQILGSVGLLEAFYARGYLTDLRTCFRQLITHNVYIDRRLLDRRLRALGIQIRTTFRTTPFLFYLFFSLSIPSRTTKTQGGTPLYLPGAIPCLQVKL